MHQKSRIHILVDNCADAPWLSEHGLSLGIVWGDEQILFDTGAGGVLEHNLALSGLDCHGFTRIVLSHGHNDHTGGLETALRLAPEAEVLYGHDAFRMRYSLHAGRPPHCLRIPEACLVALESHERKREIASWEEISDGVYVTGFIPRRSGEDCGGPFYFDLAGKEPDGLTDELALLLGDGTLIQGCCHSGIINTVEVCRDSLPQIPIRRIIGGLHLVHASEERLRQTAAYLNGLALEELVLLHCTGAEAMEYLREQVRCHVICGQAGDVFHGQ